MTLATMTVAQLVHKYKRDANGNHVIYHSGEMVAFNAPEPLRTFYWAQTTCPECLKFSPDYVPPPTTVEDRVKQLAAVLDGLALKLNEAFAEITAIKEALANGT